MASAGSHAHLSHCPANLAIPRRDNAIHREPKYMSRILVRANGIRQVICDDNNRVNELGFLVDHPGRNQACEVY